MNNNSQLEHETTMCEYISRFPEKIVDLSPNYPEYNKLLEIAIVKKPTLLFNFINKINDIKLIIRIIQSGNCYESFFSRLSDDVLSNDEIAINLIMYFPTAFHYLPDTIKNNYQYAMLAVSNYPDCLQYLTDTFKDNEYIVDKATSIKPDTVQYASKRIQELIDYSELCSIPPNPKLKRTDNSSQVLDGSKDDNMVMDIDDDIDITHPSKKQKKN